MEATGKSPAVPPRGGALKGLWVYDRERSDVPCYARQLDLMKLSGVQKATTVNLYRGIDVNIDDDGMKFSFLLSRFPLFKQTEQYTLASSTLTSRRDMKPGQQQCQLSEVPNGLKVDITWTEPNPGRISETYTCSDGETLVVHSVTEAADRQEVCRQVYKRSA